MTHYDQLLARLDGVRRAPPKPGQLAAHRACCPVCHGRNKSKLDVALREDGVILVNCFGCGGNGAAIAHAVGLNPSDLFPPRGTSSSGNGGPAAWASCASLADAVVDRALALTVPAQNDALRLALLELCDAAEAMRRAAKSAMRAEYKRGDGK